MEQLSDQLFNFEGYALPFPATAQQLEMYQNGRELLYDSDGEGQRFVKRIKSHVVKFPDRLTVVVFTGEAGGTGKETREGQFIADLILDQSFNDRLNDHKKGSRELLIHSFSLGLGMRDLRDERWGKAEDRVSSKHPNYTLREFRAGNWYIGSILDKAARALPIIYSDKANVLVLEMPFGLIMPDPYRAVIATPDTFLDVSPTVDKAQADTFIIRSNFSGEEDQMVSQFYNQVGAQIDEDVPISELAFNMGTAETAAFGRARMNERMVEARFMLNLDRNITGEYLEANPEYRNNHALREFIKYQTRLWGFTDNRVLIREGKYVEGTIHYFRKLIKTFWLDREAVWGFDLSQIPNY